MASPGHNELTELRYSSDEPSWRGGINIKVPSYQFMNTHDKDERVLRQSHLYNGNSYNGKMTSKYGIEPLVTGRHINVLSCRLDRLWYLERNRYDICLHVICASSFALGHKATSTSAEYSIFLIKFFGKERDSDKQNIDLFSSLIKTDMKCSCPYLISVMFYINSGLLLPSN